MSRNRPAYTLMEVTMALAISMLLLASMYTAFYTFVQQTQNARQIINDANSARAVFTKIADDISSHLAPLDTRLVKLPDSFFEKAPAAETTDSSTTDSSTTSSSTTDSSTTSSSTTSKSTAATQPSSSSATTQSSSSSSTTQSSSSTDPKAATEGEYAFFNLGVNGNAEILTLYVGKVPDFRLLMKNENAPPAFTDLKRITYWIAQGNNGPIGLARKEDKIATSFEAMQMPNVQGPDQEQYVIGERVVSISFQYFDGSSWLDEWNGATLASDGKTPYGPPLAIAVTIEMQTGKAGSQATEMHRHVVSIPAANGISNELPATE